MGSRAIRNSLLVTAGFVLFALLAPYTAPHDPIDQNIFEANSGISAEYWLGSDHFGRDVLSRLLWGARVSILLGVVAPLIAGVIGTLLGIAAAYYGGLVDGVTARVTDLLMAFPTLLLGVLVAATMGPGFVTVVVALSVALLPRFIRLARSSALSIRTQPYIEATVATGQLSWLIILRHILPNVSGPIVVMGTLWIATAIRLEASLSFLGLGTQPPYPSWGNMVREGLNNLFGSPLPLVFAGLGITLTVLSFNILGDEVRDAIDPEMKV